MKIFLLKFLLFIPILSFGQGNDDFSAKEKDFDTQKLEEEIDDEEEFKDYEVRVIRQKYFKKKNKIELGLQFGTVTNEAWLNNYPISVNLGFHFSNYLELEARVSHFFVSDSEEKKNLDQQSIETEIPQAVKNYSLGIVWTPLYGKFQLKKMSIFYFDMFLEGYFGSKTLKFYLVCDDINSKKVNYNNYGWGFGQRFFINQWSSIRWDMRNDFYKIDSKDIACKTEDVSDKEREIYPILTTIFEIGYSLFF